MDLKKALLSVFLFCGAVYYAHAQCNMLRPTISVDFDTDQDCAPVSVTQFRVTYSFSTGQVPNSIAILYEWNDPANSTTLVEENAGLIINAGYTEFTADANFTYNTNNDCSIIPTAYIVINGTVCPTSIQRQSAFFWSTDDQGNGEVEMAPENWDVCYDNPVVNATFRDASEFNCNIVVEPDVPNRAARHVQFVYGTNHNAAATIRNLTLTDGGPQGLTNATGNLVNPQTRGAVLPVTAAYFGPVDIVPVPADAPISVSLPMNAPADAANAVGNRFEVTMFNWNVCNPWNGSSTNPNYEDAIATRGYVEIVAAPVPAFFTRNTAGTTTTNFCIDEDIFFRNQTTGGGNIGYTWEFYNDATGTVLLNTSTDANPVYAYATGGTKLIRLTVRNTTAQGTCEAEITHTVNITPSLVAAIGLTDPVTNTPITVTDFCQETSAPFTNFNIRYTDVSTGTATATTARRWEFLDASGNLLMDAPAGGGFSTTLLGPFDRTFITPGEYDVRLTVRDNVTFCTTRDTVTIRVYEKPQPDFTFTRVCVGTPTHFRDATTLNPILAEGITRREWDMDYDGTFDREPSLDNEIDFDYTYATAGTRRVALRVVTGGGCEAIIVKPNVIVDPKPLSTFTADRLSGCSVLSVTFTNTSATQAATVQEFRWEIDNGSGTYQVDSVQRPTDPGFNGQYRREFVNNTLINIDYKVRLRTITNRGCDSVSAPVTITVFPGPAAGFVSLNYSPFDDNCSPVEVDFAVDTETQSMNPSEYIWTVADVSGQLDQISTGTTPAFTYEFQNTTQAIRDFTVTLRAVLPSTCYGDSTVSVRINPVPSSAFTFDTLSYTCDNVVLHLDATQKGLQAYNWRITINGVVMATPTGDNLDYSIPRSTTVDQNVVIRLITTNFANCPSTPTTHNVLIPRNPGISASFTALPIDQTLPDATVTLTNTSTSGPWDFLWDFGDGTTSTDRDVPPHTYATFGTYTIKLTVRDNDCIDEHIETVTIRPIPPILDFTYDPAFGCSPLTVQFTNTSQYADPGSYVWNFGDGGTSTSVNPVHTYFEPGRYSVSLTATNVLGQLVHIDKPEIIEVYDAPTAQFATYPKVLNIPVDPLYTNNRSFAATSFLWDFGDGQTSTEIEPQHKYTEEGIFTITLIAYNPSGCSDTVSVTNAVQTIKHGQLLVPNAFRPNATGPGSTNVSNNEVFLPLMRNVTKFQMFIFNRWGQLLFESSNPESGWDGYYKGQLCQQDVYIYKISVEYDDGKEFTRTGDINLLR
jgi:gliding motility-associated-like protein